MNMKTFLAAGILAALPVVASAATYSANQGTTFNGNAVAPNRSVLANAYDGNVSTFFSLGIGGTITADVSPLTVGSGSVVEVTFDNAEDYPESAEVWLGSADNLFAIFIGKIYNVASGLSSTSAGPASISSVGTPQGLTSFMIDLGGQFGSALTLVDTTGVDFAAASGAIDSDGFDVSEFAVTAVPVPAAGFLLLGGLAGMAALKRRKRA